MLDFYPAIKFLKLSWTSIVFPTSLQQQCPTWSQSSQGLRSCNSWSNGYFFQRTPVFLFIFGNLQDDCWVVLYGKALRDLLRIQTAPAARIQYWPCWVDASMIGFSNHDCRIVVPFLLRKHGPVDLPKQSGTTVMGIRYKCGKPMPQIWGWFLSNSVTVSPILHPWYDYFVIFQTILRDSGYLLGGSPQLFYNPSSASWASWESDSRSM